jgi:hypothetical protein
MDLKSLPNIIFGSGFFDRLILDPTPREMEDHAFFHGWLRNKIIKNK